MRRHKHSSSRPSDSTTSRWAVSAHFDMDIRLSRTRTPEALAAEHRAIDLVHDAIQRMDHEVRNTFTRFEFEGLTTRQIADDAGVPLGTVASRLRPARETLRGALGPRETKRRLHA